MSPSDRGHSRGAVASMAEAALLPPRPTAVSIFGPAGLLSIGITAILALSAVVAVCWWISSRSRTASDDARRVAGTHEAAVSTAPPPQRQPEERQLPPPPPPHDPPAPRNRAPQDELPPSPAADPQSERPDPQTPTTPPPLPASGKQPSTNDSGREPIPAPRPLASPKLLIRLHPEEQQRISQAVQCGGAFLKGCLVAEAAESSRPKAKGSRHAVGRLALAGLTLLECGVPSDNAAVQRAATLVRNATPGLEDTYSLSLAIMFLDRLGRPEDERRLQTFALRLIAGQNRRGGWTYECPLLDTLTEQKLLARLRDLPLLQRITSRPVTQLSIAQRPAGPLGFPARGPADAPRPLQDIAARPAPAPAKTLDLPLAPSTPLDGKVAQRSKEPTPVDRAMPAGGLDRALVKVGVPGLGLPSRLPEGRREPFPASTQAMRTGPAAGQLLRHSDSEGASGRDGRGEPQSSDTEPLPAALRNIPALQFAPNQHWPLGASPAKDDNSNTQFAILGLWAARRHGVPMDRALALVERRFRQSQNADGSWGYQYGSDKQRDSMTCAGLLGMALALGLEASRAGDKAAPEAVDPAVRKGLAFLGGRLGGVAAEPRRGPGKHGKRPGKGPGSLVGAEARGDLYYLWSVERVAVAYGLRTIGAKDWYRWGASILIVGQAADGSWNERFAGMPDTSFALLFLTRANLSRDLPRPKTP